MGEIRSHYNKKSESYNETFNMLYFRVYDVITWKYLEPYILTNSESVVLEAGGRTGRWALPIAKKGCNVVLFDASEGMLEVAAEDCGV
jgi:ubiquinone/menaquinone biosynthesis C-methylase UbiE